LPGQVLKLESRIDTLQKTVETAVVDQPLSLTDERFQSWTSRVVKLTAQLSHIAADLGVDFNKKDPSDGALMGKINSRLTRLEHRAPSVEAKTSQPPAYAAAVAATAPPKSTSAADGKTLLTELELRLTKSLASKQALDLASKSAESAAKSAETSRKDLRLHQAQHRLDVSSLRDELNKLRLDTNKDAAATKLAEEKVTGLERQIALLWSMALFRNFPSKASTPGGSKDECPCITTLAFEDL
jgi:hypothetical protein